MSGEHILSKAILELINSTHDIGISGVAWISEGLEARLAPSALQSNVLCVKHNKDLSTFDAEALSFFRFLKNTYDDSPDEWQGPNQIVIDGHKLQNWSLKIMCGLLASHQFADRQNKGIGAQIAEDWLERLFRSVPWPQTAGLCIDEKLISAYDPHDWFQGTLMRSESNQPLGFTFQLCGLPMILCTSDVSNLISGGAISAGAILFPNGIEWLKDGRARRVKFHWAPEPNHKWGLKISIDEQGNM
jgi:hypothetical protein